MLFLFYNECVIIVSISNFFKKKKTNLLIILNRPELKCFEHFFLNVILLICYFKVETADP